MEKIAVIRVRGKIGVKKDVKNTLDILHLHRTNSCVVILNTKNYIGMLKKIKDYVTWGEISEDVFKILLKKRGKLPGSKPLDENYLKEKLNLSYDQFVKEFFDNKKTLKDVPGLKLFFRLTPPTSGFERGGIKKPFSLGGALGYRKDKINDLIRRMI